MRGYVPDCEVTSPSSLEVALELLAAEPGLWRPMAGGTDLMVPFNAGNLPYQRFLDLSRIEALRGITEDDASICFGAFTTFSEMRDFPGVHRYFPNLVKSARITGALAIQNRGTLGGNIANASPAADTPPSLLAYDAELELLSARGSRWVSYGAFHRGYKQMDLTPDELIAKIRVPKPRGLGFHFYRKVGTRQAQAISKVCLAAYARTEAGVLVEIRIGLGSVAPTPLRAVQAEAALLGKRLVELPVKAAREALMADICPIDDIRSTARYRRVVAGNVLEQMLAELAKA